MPYGKAVSAISTAVLSPPSHGAMLILRPSFFVERNPETDTESASGSDPGSDRADPRPYQDSESDAKRNGWSGEDTKRHEHWPFTIRSPPRERGLPIISLQYRGSVVTRDGPAMHRRVKRGPT